MDITKHKCDSSLDGNFVCLLCDSNIIKEQLYFKIIDGSRLVARVHKTCLENFNLLLNIVL